MSSFINLNPEFQSNHVTVDVWSDIVCPFCYIGKRNLEKALEITALSNDTNIVWHSFELAPDTVTDPSVSIYEALGQRKGWSIEQSRQIHKQMEQRALESGLVYNFDRTIPANSFKAHRLLHLALKRSVQNEAKELLLKAYFTDGMNIDDETILINLGTTIGLHDAEIRAALMDDSNALEVRKDIDAAQKLGINGVPFFVFNQKYAISGAQPVEVFVQALTKVSEESRGDQFSSNNADSCGMDGVC